MPRTFRLSFDISAEADPSDLLDRLIDFQQQLVDELEEGEDFFGETVPNHATADTCSVEHISTQEAFESVMGEDDFVQAGIAAREAIKNIKQQGGE